MSREEMYDRLVLKFISATPTDPSLSMSNACNRAYNAMKTYASYWEMEAYTSQMEEQLGEQDNDQ